MSDTKISALPAISTASDADMLPIVQGSGSSAVTRRTTLAQLRSGILSDREYHVRDYGAVGDGATNDAPAIQAAIDAMNAAGGGVLQFGARTYRLASPIVVDGVSVIFQGAGFTEGATAADGTWFSITTTGFTPFTFTGGGARGSAVRDIGVRQTHSATQDSSWAPTAYDFVFRVQDCLGMVEFRNLMLSGVNRGIWCDNSGRLNIEGLRGQIFTTGIEIDRAYETCRIQHVHLWPFNSADDDVVRWQQQNGDAIVLRRVDGIFLDDIFVLGARSVLRFASSSSGVTTKFYVGSLYADFALYPIWIEAHNVAGQIANATTQSELFNASGAALTGSIGLRVDGNNARLQIGNLRVDDAHSNAIRVNGTGNRIDIFSFRAEYYNTLNDGSAAIHLANVASGTANAVHLGSPALLGNGNAGPLLNSSTNGYVALGAPAGRIDRPGVLVGEEGSGLYLPATGELAATTAGAETMRLTAAGTATLGGPSATAPFSVTAATSNVNRVKVTGAATGGIPTIAADGTDTNVNLQVAPKGTGTLRLMGRNNVVVEAASAATTPVNYFRLLSNATGSAPQLAVGGSDTNISISLIPKGTGVVTSSAPIQLPTYTIATLPTASSYARCLVYVSDGTSNKRFAVSDGTSWRWPDGAVVS